VAPSQASVLSRLDDEPRLLYSRNMQLKGIPFFVKNKCFLNLEHVTMSPSEKFFMFVMRGLETIFHYV
jgi:hypothetical protein